MYEYISVTVVCCFRFLYEVLFAHGLSPVTAVFMASKKKILTGLLTSWLTTDQTDRQTDGRTDRQTERLSE